MIVIVHGYEGSGPGHWQHWLHGVLRERGVPVVFPALPNPAAPVLDTWLDALSEVVATRGGAPVTFVAHSLGCWAVDHWLARHGSAVVRAALLVAPPSPFSLFEPIQGFLPPPRDRTIWAPIATRSSIVGSDDDDYASEDEFEELGARLGVPHQILPSAGHINAARGFGPFPLALAWLDGLDRPDLRPRG